MSGGMASGHSKGALDKPSLLLASLSESTPSVSLQALLCWFGHPIPERIERATSEGGQCQEEKPRATNPCRGTRLAAAASL